MTKDNKAPTPESLLTEYRLSQEMATYYGRIVWTIGTIFHPATLAGFAFGLSQKLEFPLAAIFALFLTGLQAFFLLSYHRLQFLSKINNLRCQEIEDELGLKQHKLHREIKEKGKVTIANYEIKKQKIWSSPVINYLIPWVLIVIIWIWVFTTNTEWYNCKILLNC